ncbi:DUF551 domain-containing protein [Xenorhabdus budapestensis]|uniref:DUF551 domain-containing protein n=1 Tax=Xenorhabdus budapestensis TaxID=290110 RepID=A0ABX7VG22_XENBU|nr:DUF551 domain-containing protein [Xenorhabdus budapestensis]QTL38757.1 DUF551 domain-containing protein [Xenorhabdus budapestensis]
MEWIKCSDRLPEIDKIVLGYEFLNYNNTYRCSLYGRVDDGEFWYWGKVNQFDEIEVDDEYDVQFWMPLPQPPTGE